MNGAEHYREAERCIDGYAELLDDFKKMLGDNATNGAQAAATAIADSMLHKAQVHATLALAAASLVDALDPFRSESYKSRIASWSEAVS